MRRVLFLRRGRSSIGGRNLVLLGSGERVRVRPRDVSDEEVEGVM